MCNMKKERTLGIRLGDLTKMAEDFEASTGLSCGTIAKELLRDVLEYWKQHGEIKWPMVAVPRSEYDRLSTGANRALAADLALVAEKGEGYAAGKKKSA
jgi:hypothetical protein